MEKITSTVYIVSNNYGKYLKDAIDSVLSQSYDEWELLLINDNSTDNTAEVMELYRGDPRVRILNTQGIGLPAAANLAHRESRGDYLVRLDADDFFDKHALLVLSHHLNYHPEVALVFPDYYLIDDQGGMIRHERRSKIYSDNHLLDMPANGACTMIRNEILKKVGGYREDLGAQDGFDIWSKITKEHRCSNVNLPLFYYRRHGANLTENTARILSARRAIKQDAANGELERFRPIISIIPCRKNYDILPDLWNQRLDGTTLLDIAINNNIASKIFEKIIITSDNPETEKVLEKYDDPRLEFILRDMKLTIPSCSMVNTVDYIINKIGIGAEGLSVLSYIQAPFTTTKNIEEAVYTLVMNDADSSFAVEEVYRPLYKRTHYGLVPINNTEKFRTDFDIIYRDAQTALATKNSNIRSGSLMGPRVANFVVPKEESFFIHTKKDFEIARHMLGCQ